MIARRLPSILPPLAPGGGDRGHAHPVGRGPARGRGLVTARPFRSPHHTISAAGLVGGANPPQPGEATLAHRGVLFLDELSEFARPSLEALRQPLEDGHVTIVRGQQVIVFPTSFMLVAASNPCPCGYGEQRCQCTQADLVRHRRRLSGPLLDRIDILMRVERPPAEALRQQIAPASAAGPRARRRRPRAPAAPARRPARDLQRPADVEADPRPRPDHPERPAAARRALRPAHALGPRPHADPARRPHGRRPRRLRRRRRRARERRREPALRGRRPARGGGMTRVRRLPAPDRPDRGDGRAPPDRVQAAHRARAGAGAARRGPAGPCRRGGDPAPVRDVRRGRGARAGRGRRAGDGLRLPRRVSRSALRDLADPPAVLHVRGDPAALQAEEAVAVVGARQASSYGIEIARALGRGLSAARVPVVSGLALGVDSAAHDGALEAPGPTIGVLAGSAHIAYPARGWRLHAAVARARRGDLRAAARGRRRTAGASSPATGSSRRSARSRSWCRPPSAPAR